MSVTALAGALVVFGQAPTGSSVALEYNQSLGASLFYAGVGLLDQRNPLWAYQPGMAASEPVNGWSGVDNVSTLSYVPSTLNTQNICGLQSTQVAGFTATLVSSTALGVTVSCALTNANTGAAVTGALGIDLLTGTCSTVTISGTTCSMLGTVTGALTIGTVLTGTGVTTGTKIIGFGTGAGAAGTYIVDTPQTVGPIAATGIAGTAGIPTVVSPGSTQQIRLYNPLCMLGRNVRISSTGDDSLGTFTVNGYDCYGYPMSEAITGGNAALVSGKKAFKYISSIVGTGTFSGNTFSVGTGDVFGLPLYSQDFYDTTIFWNAGLIIATTGYVAGVTAAATTTTGDVRGTYAVQSASDGSKRLVVRQSPRPVNIMNLTGLFGVAQA